MSQLKKAMRALLQNDKTKNSPVFVVLGNPPYYTPKAVVDFVKKSK